MNIVLNEKEFAQNAIRSLSLGSRPYEVINRVARYNRLCSNTNEEAIRKTEEFLLRCDKYVNLFDYRDTIEQCVKQLKTRPLIEIDAIHITKSEMDAIATLSSVYAKMVVFTMLCLAKYWNAVNPKNNNWINRSYSELFKLANLKCNEDRRTAIMREVFQSGLVGYSMRATSENTFVTFVDDSSDVVLTICDFRDLGYQYRRAIGDPYIQCELCGAMIKKTGRRQTHCAKCAQIEKLNKQAERRSAAKNQN